MSVLPYLVSDPSALAANWEEAPFVSTGLRDIGELFSLETVEQLIGPGSLPLSCVRLVRDGTTVSTRRFGRRAERQQNTDLLVDGAAVQAEVAAGTTLIVEELQTYSPAMAAFARELAAETGYLSYCAAFITPGDVRGAAPHYDQMSVFIVQVHGSKRWRVGRPAQRWPAKGWSARQHVETDTVLEAELEVGQSLYIPRGFIHSGTAGAAASVHLSIGLRPLTWAMIVRDLTDSALGAERLREALPYGFHAMEPQLLRALLAERLREFITQLERLGDGDDADLALAKVRPGCEPAGPAIGSLRTALTGPAAVSPGRVGDKLG